MSPSPYLGQAGASEGQVKGSRLEDCSSRSCSHRSRFPSHVVATGRDVVARQVSARTVRHEYGRLLMLQGRGLGPRQYLLVRCVYGGGRSHSRTVLVLEYLGVVRVLVYISQMLFVPTRLSRGCSVAVPSVTLSRFATRCGRTVAILTPRICRNNSNVKTNRAVRFSADKYAEAEAI